MYFYCKYHVDGKTGIRFNCVQRLVEAVLEVVVIVFGGHGWRKFW